MHYGSRKRRNRQYNCEVCGTSAGIQIHHVIHRSRGGSNHHRNLQALCATCHYNAHNVWLIPSGIRVDAESVKSAEVLVRRKKARAEKLAEINRIKAMWGA